MNFESLVRSLVEIHRHSQSVAFKAVNAGLTLRNWLIGAYIEHFELHGDDRAAYGRELFGRLASRLEAAGIPNCNKSRLYRYRDFYRLYPQMATTLSPSFKGLLAAGGIRTSRKKMATVPPQSSTRIVATPSPLSGRLILDRLSYSHIELLVEIDESQKRAFYEIECIKGGWSVRELKRQIASLYFERSGLSYDKNALSRLANESAETQAPNLVLRDPYVFEFLGMRPKDVLPESDLENALLDKLQEFLLELGRGFCFEARQKRILIGDEHFFVDLVFYHRILKCHILIELKTEEFNHENLGQLNTYVSWFREHEMAESDNPPVGILLCTKKNHALVKYALAGMDNRLFVSKYQVELPQPEQLQRYLDQQRRLLDQLS